MTRNLRKSDIAPAEAGRQSPQPPATGHRRRRTMRQHFCDGLEAAVKAEPYPFATTKPRTILGLMVRELVLDAARAKCAAIKLVFDYLDQAERERTQAETDGAEHGSQGNPEPGRAPEPQWDRDETTGWDSSRREDEYLTFERRAAERAAEAEPREDGRDPQTEALRNGLLQRCLRAAEADRENEARLARLAEARADRPPPGPSVPFSGNSGAPHNAGTMRIGGKLVEGWSGAAACVLRQAQHEGSFTAVGSRAGNKG